MDGQRITSAQNPAFRRIRAIAAETGAESKRYLFLEGVRLCRDAVRAGLEVDTMVLSERAADSEEVTALVREARTGTGLILSDSLFRQAAQTETPQGVAGVFIRPDRAASPAELPEGTRFLLLEEVQDPGNVGTIVRTADAMGFDAVLITSGTADPYRAKALRAAMGSTFHLPLLPVSDAAEGIRLLRRAGCRIVASDLSGTVLSPRRTWPEPVALLLGNEGAGLRPDTTALADERIRVPMWGRAESLNVACAAAILCYSMRVDDQG